MDGFAEPPRTLAAERVRRVWRRAPARVRRPLQSLADRVYHATRAATPERRRFFAVPTNDNCGGIRLNVAGREPRGIVRRGAELDATCAELTDELLALTEVHSGRPVVREVLRSDQLFRGEHLDDLPDLLVRWHRELPITGVSSPRVGRVEHRYLGNRTGDHRADGALFIRGAGLAARALDGPVAVTDIAPTLAALLGVVLPDVDGRPLDAVVPCARRASRSSCRCTTVRAGSRRRSPASRGRRAATGS
jgi:hypothetical protein